METVKSRLHLMRQRALDAIAYAMVRSIVALIQIMPLDMGDRFCRVIATILSGPLPVRKRVIQSTLSQIFPDLPEPQQKELTFAMWHHLMLMVCEVAWAQRRLHRCNWYRHVRFRGSQTMLRSMLSDRSSVYVTGHFGNFEVGGYTMGLMGVRTLAIARRLDNRFLHDWVENFRSAKGQDVVDKIGCAPIVEKHLQEGGMLSLLADQHAGEKGLWTDFCGVPASCHKALALFSLTANAPMMSVYTRRIDGKPMQFESGLLGVVDPATDSENGQSVGQMTEWYNRQLESMIDIAPEQYWWLHRRWRTPPEKVARRLEKKREKALLASAAPTKASTSQAA
ncbi:Lipid A biosynthesis lauroyl acyltransferase [Rhodopirellula islandica]|uniref:Lipid A biosynthesis lauroyl acyltransferase n=1 Tax=Rhodopirellula islandica TaxID=595434 RepID=A0A0J1EK83_RHOIS|nr:lysophospholipid acyltransferase family protein [Rhodopirellula islandica]KLU05914.1 Lipid A biosynthesis lauroyl acyltransferase [Rhodopirellula islandica]